MLHGWLIKSQESSKVDSPKGQKLPLIIFYHGNASNIGARLPLIESFQFNKVQAHYLLMEYRGFGKCTGKPSQTGFESDTKELMSYIRSDEFMTKHPELDHSKIYVQGISLGGAVAIYLA